MHNLDISFIGGGNMAEAMIAGLVRAGHKPQQIGVSEPNAERMKFLTDTYGVHACTSNADALSHADITVLAVKPQQMQQAVNNLGMRVKSDATVVSIAAGLTTEKLQKFLGSHVNLVRAMPNTPALVGAGVSVLFSDAAEVHRQRAEYVLAASGAVYWVTAEKQLHAVTALSGSGPAYFFLLTEVMQAAGESLGLPQELAEHLAEQTALGAGRMLVESGRTAQQLRQQVTSPGGTTQAALDVMYEKGLPDAVRKAIAAASKRSVELGS
ncbi:MAG TPA: pyrroline-5-carboxylate reductase [Mariprofundaceae bacterium]|nr:pyrroline-5-carboxylate reductase [Mariprofundaceae bacterium]